MTFATRNDELHADHRSHVHRPPLVFLLGLVGRWYDRHLQRLDLATLSDEALRDIGVSTQEARRESTRPFWR